MTRWTDSIGAPQDVQNLCRRVTGISREANGSKISVEIKAENQRGDTTGVGAGSAIVPTAYLPAEE